MLVKIMQSVSSKNLNIETLFNRNYLTTYFERKFPGLKMVEMLSK